MVLLALVLALALILPRLSVFGRKMLLGVAIVPIVYCLFYIIVRPGWTVARIQRSHPYGRWALFLACSMTAMALAAGFILR
jgi:hypothetical protein